MIARDASPADGAALLQAIESSPQGSGLVAMAGATCALLVQDHATERFTTSDLVEVAGD